MKLSNRATKFFFLTAIMLVLLFRSLFLKLGGDSGSGLIKSSAITTYGLVPWFIHPTSFFGWHPFSYPAGEYVILSAISQIIGVNLYTLAFWFPTIISCMGAANVFLLSREFKHDNFFSIITVFIVITLNKLTTVTYHNLSSRGLFMLYYAIVLYLLIRVFEDKRPTRYIALFLASVMALASIHRMILLFILSVIIPFLIIFIMKRSNYIFRVNINRFYIPHVFLTIICYFICEESPISSEAFRVF